MLSKNLFRISPYTSTLPKYLSNLGVLNKSNLFSIASWSYRTFSNKENDALARMLKSKDTDASGLSKEEKKSRGYNAGIMEHIFDRFLTLKP